MNLYDWAKNEIKLACNERSNCNESDEYYKACCESALRAYDFLLDDGTHNLEGGNYNKILFTAPHNKSYDTYKNNMYRADCWKDVYNIIHKLQGSQK